MPAFHRAVVAAALLAGLAPAAHRAVATAALLAGLAPAAHRAVVAAALLAGLAPAPAAQARPAGGPAAVDAVIRRAERTCREEGGERIAVAPEAIERRDLDGDGRTDIVINHRDITCEGALSAYCGTAGCHHVVLLARAGGRYRRILDGRIRAYAVEGRGLKLLLHGGFCGRGGVEACSRRYRLDGRRIGLG
jgi:hypothetical protein